MVKIAHPLLGLSAAILLFCSTIPAQVIDANVYVPPQYLNLTPPDAGQPYVDPAFGTSIKRVTNAPAQLSLDSGGMLTFITDEYSTMSPFNLDNSKILLVFQSYFGLFDGAGNFLKNCPLEISASSEPRWSRTDRDVVYYHYGNQLRSYNTATDGIAILHVFSEYGSISGKGESDISSDGDHFVLVGDNRYIFVYEISSNTKGPVFDAGGNSFDSVYITPNNNITVTWLQPGSGRYNGIELFDWNMNFLRQVSRAGGHMDVTRDTNGDEVLIWTNSNDPAPICGNGIVKIRLMDGQQTCLLSLDWSLAVHISAPDGSGWVFVETYAPSDPLTTPAWKAYTNEILQIKLDGSEVRRLAHHRSRPFNSYNYQPHVSVSRDGSRLIYNSNFGLQASAGYPAEYSDVYFIAVSSSSPGTPGYTPTGAAFEQDSATVSYAGPWFTHTSAGHSGGSAWLAMDAGARATFTFSGSAVSWIGYRDEWSGIANVYLDGQFKGTVNTFASPSQFQSVLFTQSGLAEGSHSLTIEATGTTNSAGSWIWIDAFQVTAVSTPPVPVINNRIEQNSSAVLYSGNWYDNGLSAHSGGSAVLSMDAGSRATFTFSGSAVSWIGYRDEWSGIANVYLDGQFKGTVDTVASPPQFQSVLFTESGLAEGSHSLTIEATGTTNSAGSWIWIDAFQVTAVSTPPAPVINNRIEQNGSAVLYSGNWYDNGLSAHSGGSAVLSMDAGSRASLAFTGTGVSWIGYKDAWSGIAYVYIDNRNPIRIDTYSSSEVAQKKIYTIGGLAKGNHTITIAVTGQKRRLSKGSWIWLDAFDIIS